MPVTTAASSPCDKCVILARGLGKRMRRADAAATLDRAQAESADAGVKALIPVGRPFIDYVLSGLADAGLGRVCLVIGPEHRTAWEQYLRERCPRRLEVEVVEQAEAIGTANALLWSENFVAEDQFVVINGDNYYPIEVMRLLRELGGPGTVLFDPEPLVRDSNIPAERLADFAYGEIDPAGYLTDLVEKPPEGVAAVTARGRWVSMNCWRFGPDIFPCCRAVPLSPRNEFELPAAVRLAIGSGMKLRVKTCQAGVLDLSRRSDVAAVTAMLSHIRVDL